MQESADPAYRLVDQLTAEWTEAVNSVLREFNRTQNPTFWAALDRPEGTARNLNVLAFDARQSLIGGLFAETRLSWLTMSVLAVATGSRGRGIGSRLVAIAEAEAVARGCRYAFADTMDYQAPEFYRRLDYQVVGRLDDWDSHGHAKLFLVKQLHGSAAGSG